MVLTSGTRVGSYEIEVALGIGAMGEVYRARDPLSGRVVAIRILTPLPATDPDLRSRFEQAAHAAATLHHPHICAVYEVGRHGSLEFVASECLEGESLAATLRGGLPWEVALQYSVQLSDALSAAHQRGLPHRHLSPSNVIVTNSGLKILDFVASNAFTRRGSESTNAAPVATPYAAPEQLAGNSGSPASDVFSFGAVLYEMLTGQPPFSGQSHTEVVAAAVHERLPSPLDRAPDVPRALSDLVMRCLSIEETARPRIDSVGRCLHAIADASRASRRSNPGARRRHQQIHVIAVLPIAAALRSQSSEALSQAITDGLITELASFPAIRVISRGSVMEFDATTKRLTQIAAALNVDAVLTGSWKQGVGSRLALTLALMDGLSEACLWTRSYRFERRDIVAVQERAAHAVAQRIRPGAMPRTQAAPALPVSHEGYEAFVKGRFHFDNRIGDWLESSFDAFQTAMAHDGRYAPVHAALSRWHIAASIHATSDRPVHERTTEWRDALARAEAAARHALDLDPELAEAHTALGQVMWLQWRFGDARTAYVRALQLNPSAAMTHASYSECLAILNRPAEAIEHAEIAVQLDPLTTYSHEALARALYCARRFRECVSACQAGLQVMPRAGVLSYFQALGQLASGASERAVSALREVCELMRNHPLARAALAVALAQCGGVDEARGLLLLVQQDDAPVSVAEASVALGDLRLALDALEAAFERHLPNLLSIGVDPMFDGLRGDPRFERLLREIGLPSRSFT
jgi:serine/threonine protein kinase/Flp pilus assembly protein TadD